MYTHTHTHKRGQDNHLTLLFIGVHSHSTGMKNLYYNLSFKQKTLLWCSVDCKIHTSGYTCNFYCIAVSIIFSIGFKPYSPALMYTAVWWHLLNVIFRLNCPCITPCTLTLPCCKVTWCSPSRQMHMITSLTLPDRHRHQVQHSSQSMSRSVEGGTP